MEIVPYTPTAVDMAWEVIEQHRELSALRAEVVRLEAIEVKYHKLLADTLRHSQEMSGNVLAFVLACPGLPQPQRQQQKEQ